MKTRKRNPSIHARDWKGDETMATGIPSPLKTGTITVEPDPEIDLLDRLETALARNGFRANRIDLVNFYVTLKHRPLAILAGPAGNGKVALLGCMAELLTGRNVLQRQIAPGHAWYAGSPANTALIGMHVRMITEKLLFAIDEASQPENAQRPFIVGLTHISPAEQLDFFTEVGYQLQHGHIMRVGDVHLSEPIPFPPNLRLIGTLDTSDCSWWDDDLLLPEGNVVQWSADVSLPQDPAAGESRDFGHEFMRSRIRDSQRAYQKLVSVVTGIKQPLQIIMLLRDVFRTYGLELPPGLLDDVILYLANAWSRRGTGLFEPVAAHNLQIAFDLAVAQFVLPQNQKTILSSEKLQTHLCSILRDRLPRSSALLNKQCNEHNSIIQRKELQTPSCSP
jgi:hypothetical protein